MNRYENGFLPGREAKVRYMDADYRVLEPGDHVICAVTGQPIKLDTLKYWSVEHQEAYATAEIALSRYLELTGRAKS